MGVPDYRRHFELTKREQQVLALADSGMSVREIARTLNLSIQTVKQYLYEARAKRRVADAVKEK